MSNDVHAVLRAIKSGSAKTLQSIIESDPDICLREALGGPRKKNKLWNFSYHIKGISVS